MGTMAKASSTLKKTKHGDENKHADDEGHADEEGHDDHHGLGLGLALGLGSGALLVFSHFQNAAAIKACEEDCCDTPSRLSATYPFSSGLN